MGLDQYEISPSMTRLEGRCASASGKNNEELAYWRKHNRLHGWMEDLYRDRGNAVEHEAFGNSFNCVEVELMGPSLTSSNLKLISSRRTLCPTHKDSF